ncbi:hypothetical protein BN988_02836 [Oceanobacillus picturae]|uniref:RNase H type-1 domain-containing protein n=1 Tax=Oceanobacillus picturae TaxID=171693 RepID=W9AMZ4_9BACI|nr:hypothetical protein [Oceanobacillus picturae]CDO04282.1 hypothetical protein BN988_02836 [Oceanobacillus picturae]
MVQGNRKQQLMRREKVPTTEAKERAEKWLFDNETLRVFVDASELNYQGIFGLGVCFVGQGKTLVKSKKHYNLPLKTNSVYAEIVAIDYALDLLKKVMCYRFDQPLKVVIYSDCIGISSLESKPELTRQPAINELAEQIKKKYQFNSITELEISYMDKGLKRYNPYYRAAHNASRKLFGKSK